MSHDLQHVKSRCGGGKTSSTIEYLYPFITENPNEKVIFSSKTNNLTAQSFYDFKAIPENVGGFHPSLQRIDSTTVPSSSTVSQELNKRLDRNEGGVIFVSHAILRNIDPAKLGDVRLIIDEVPDILVKHLRVHYEYMDQGSTWEALIKTEPYPGTEYQKVTLDPNGSEQEVKRRIDNIRLGIDNSVTYDVADLLEFLLEGHDVMYTTSQNTNGKLINLYLATDWKQLENLVTHSKRMAILSSQIRNTLVGYVLEKIMNIPIVDTPIHEGLTLPDKHAARTVIYPLVEGDRWSSRLKNEKASERLLLHGKPVPSTQSVGMYTQEVAHEILGGEPTLLIINNKDDKHDCWEGYPLTQITSSAHGRNDYSGYHHAIFLSSNRPDQHETNALRLFAKHHNLCPDEIIRTVLKERCHEAAYQSIARTSVRNQNKNLETPHIFVVPDEAHAEYLESWFDSGTVTIDRSYLHQRKSTTRSEKRDQDMFNILVRIRTEYLAGKGQVKDLKQKYGLNDKKYQRYVKKFRSKLEPTGLLDRKADASK